MLDPTKLEALARAAGLPSSASNIEKVARATSPEAAGWAFTQWALRKQAKNKFELSEEMLFTREALEQSTSERLARYHASRFPTGKLVADLTVGIGADLIALSRRGPALGFEIDAERADYARHNLQVHNLEAEIRVQDCFGGSWDFQYAFADPARRLSGARTLNPDDFQPNPTQLTERMASLDLGLIKLTPMLPDKVFKELGGSVEYLSLGKECREALLFVDKNERTTTAVQIETGARLESGGYPPFTEDPEQYLYEADPAAIRADCLSALADDLDLRGLGDSNGYLTGSHLWLKSSWLTPYKVLAFHRADLSTTRTTLESLGSGTPVIKSRAGIDVDALRKSLKLKGKRELIVAVYAVGRSLRHVILEKM